MTTTRGDTHTILTHPAAPHLGGNLFGGDTRCIFPDLWAWLVARYSVRSVFDVGCGEGYSMEWFKTLGCDVVGLDGLPHNALESSKYGPCVLHDLTKGSFTAIHADLVWCCEVVEHVAPEFVDHVAETLASGKVLAMTHALPDQAGWHHVNCQPPAYWIERMAKHGMRFDVNATNRSREIAAGFWGVSGMIFTREAAK